MTWLVGTFAVWLAAWALNARIAASGWARSRPGRVFVPILFGATILMIWEGLVRGLNVAPVILPPPSAIAAKVATSLPTLWVDFAQTFLKGALPGFLIGCGAAVAVAIAIDRSPFLQRGLLPIGNFVAALPIYRDATITHVLVLTGDVRDPFSALDEEFLRALGRQVGSALQQAELTHQLEERTGELARLSSRLVEQHEDERKRLARELHDETGQLFSAMRMEVGALQGVSGAGEVATRMDALVTAGLTSLRRVTAALRPSLLDDLGLLSAVRSLVAQLSREEQIRATLEAPEVLAPMPRERELALFRAAQEGITNVLRHAGATRLHITMQMEGDDVRLTVDDDGVGPPSRAHLIEQERGGHVGLVGMRERLALLGGRMSLERSAIGGTRLQVVLRTGAVNPEVAS